MKTAQTSLAATALTALALFANPAHAQVGTGSLAGWSALGDVVSQNGAITLTTAFLDGAGDEASNLSGTSAAGIAEVEAAAGVGPFALDLPPDHFATEGSVVRQSFAAGAGQTLSFDWSFSTVDDLYLDHAFVVIDGQVITLATRAQPGFGSQSFSFVVTHANQVTVSFGVVDTDDVAGVSSLSIANLQFGAVTAPIPEPSTWALLASGLVLLGGLGRRRPAEA